MKEAEAGPPFTLHRVATQLRGLRFDLCYTLAIDPAAADECVVNWWIDLAPGPPDAEDDPQLVQLNDSMTAVEDAMLEALVRADARA